MHINTELSTETSAATLQRQRAETGTTASKTSSTATKDAAVSQLDPSLQRLTAVPSSVQDGDWDIKDEQGAGQAVAFARQNMLQQPTMVMSAQANQLSQNVVNLLQPAD